MAVIYKQDGKIYRVNDAQPITRDDLLLSLEATKRVLEQVEKDLEQFDRVNADQPEPTAEPPVQEQPPAPASAPPTAPPEETKPDEPETTAPIFQ